MGFNINSKYGELMNSAKWNERFKTIVGTNAVLSGLTLEVRDGKAIILPGKCVVAGAEIDSIDEEILDLSSYRGRNVTLTAIISYIHNPTRVEFGVVLASQQLAGNQAALSTFIYENDAIVEVENVDKVLSLSELLTYIKENPGDKIFDTIEERDEFPEKKLYVGFSCFVIEKMASYFYKGNREWGRESTNALFVGSEEPTDKTVLWVDDADEEIEGGLSSEMWDNIQETMNNFSTRVGDIEYALTKELDPGFFGGVMPGEGEDEEDKPSETVILGLTETPNGRSLRIIDIPGDAIKPEYPDDDDEDREDIEPNIDKGAKGTVEHILVLRGYKKDIPTLLDGEMAFCIDTEELYIGNKGFKKLLAKVGGMTGGGSGNITSEYIELISQDNTKFRVKVNNDGKLYTYKSIADTASKPIPSDAPKYAGLIINHAYGGGARQSNLTPCSHGFIELYNTTDKEINLRGLYLQYAESGTNWQVLELNGIIKPLHSFLVRCAEHTDINRKTTKFKVSNYDMCWDIALGSNGMKLYLGINPEPLTIANPCSIDGQWSKEQGYIDLFVFASENPIFQMDAYERNPDIGIDGFQKIGSIFNSAHRKDFIDENTSFTDIEKIDLRTADPIIYRPRYSGDGQWINYYNKLKLSDKKPNMINICFGKDGNATRTFTWQSTPTINGFLKYKKVGSSNWIVIETKKQEVSHYDTNAIIHRVILRDLTPGKYTYIAGEEGAWSDEYEFEIKAPTPQDTIKFIFTTDQQGINEEEYIVWKKAYNEIKKYHGDDYDFHLNTGDISNDGGEFAFQWRYYYNYAASDLCTKPHMTTCGNNDLTRDFATDGKKRDPEAFGWYTTIEDEFMTSCYSWNYGDIHFVCLNSNTLIDKNIASQQVPWLIKDLEKPENQKRWTIVYMHEAPYTIIKQAAMAPFIDVFAEYGVDLVLCGHHHRYSRSHRMGAQGPNGEDRLSSTGFYTIMSQATGYKLMGKTNPADSSKAPWRAMWDNVGNPTYCTLEVTREKIKIQAYSIANILPTTDTDTNSPERTLFDTLEITKAL